MRLATLIEQAAVMEMPEGDFARFVHEVESSDLFKKLRERDRVIRYQRFPRSDISRHFSEAETPVADAGCFDAELLLEHRHELAGVIRKIGLETFKRYFLHPDETLSGREVAQVCGLDVEEVRRINELVDDFSLASEFYHPSAIRDRTVRYSRVAGIEHGSDDFVIAFYSPAHARGRFVVDHEKLEKLKQQGVFSKAQMKAIRGILRKLELINNRRDTLYRILQVVVARQGHYLNSGNPRALLPFTQNELARIIKLAPSSVSRAIALKSVDTPWGEKPLKEFFPRPRRFRRDLIAQVLAREDRPLSDEAVRAKLKQEHGVAISRREVASLRSELKIPNSRHRRPKKDWHENCSSKRL